MALRGSVSADDRETPLCALEDVSCLLDAQITDKNEDLVVYDPYYCKGGIKIALGALGYRNVHNEDVDCYTAWKASAGSPGAVPKYHVLLTNPPYSADHIRRVVHYAIKSGKPWAMLLPSNVLQRDWFVSITEKSKCKMVFVAPFSRYSFVVPDSDTSTSTSTSGESTHTPLATIWFIGGVDKGMVKRMQAAFERRGSNTRARLATTQSELPRKILKLLPYALGRANKKKGALKGRQSGKRGSKPQIKTIEKGSRV